MKRIYLVEDDHSLANLTKTALIKEGYEVKVFHEAVQAMESAKTEAPDLILMDIMLPHVSGGEAVKQLNNDEHLKNIPVVFLTGLVSHDEDIEKTGVAIDGKNYKTLGKPYGMFQLLGMVKEVLEGAARP